MRYLLRSSLSVLLAFCMVFSNSYYAIASTTTEQSYDIMPLDVDNSFDLTALTGYYDRVTDTYYSNSNTFSGLSNGSILVPSSYIGVSNSLEYNVNYLPLYGFQLGTDDRNSSLSIPDGSTLRLQVNNIVINYTNAIPDIWNYYLPHDKAVPFKVYGEMYFTAMQVVGNTHSSTYHRQVVSLNNCFVPSDEGHPAEWNIDAIIPVVADKTIGEGIDRIYNINLRSVKLYVVFDWTSYYDWVTHASDIKTSLIDSLPVGSFGPTSMRFMNYGADSPFTSRVYLTYDTSGGSSVESALNASTFSIQNTVNNMGTNLNRQITQVKSQITQSTNTINSRIDTMSSNIQQGLQNVVQSAQQNTQNIINTVTQKVDEVKTGITEVKDSIIDLPNKLEEKVLSLVVPEQDVIESKFSEIEDLLRGRFGLIYQAEEVIVDFANSLQTSTATTEASGGKIIFPSVVINLPDETAFNFGGYEVDLIPDGFETLANAVRLAVNMVCTAIFINMCKNKLEVIFK